MTKLFPALFSSPSPDYESARRHSEQLDEVLGFNIPAIENALLGEARELNPEGTHKTWGQTLHGGNQTWVGLSHQTLQTPYNELKHICELLNPPAGSTIVDLGAGYGRLGLVLAGMYPEVNFIGYEYVKERVVEGSRILNHLRCERARLLEKDLTRDDFFLPAAEFYFLYDYGTVAHIRKTLGQIEQLASKQNFKLVARGKGTRSLIQYEHPWLSQVYPAIHEEQFSIFSMSDSLFPDGTEDPV